MRDAIKHYVVHDEQIMDHDARKDRSAHCHASVYSTFIRLDSSFIRSLPLIPGLSLRVLITTHLQNQLNKFYMYSFPDSHNICY